MRQKATIGILIAAILAVGFVCGFFLAFGTASTGGTASSTPIRADLTQYKFINPLLFTESGTTHAKSLAALQSSMQNYVDSAEKADPNVKVSVYFRDLEGGTWTGVDEDDTYSPSSMLKVVAMMAALKVAEDDPAVLTEKLAMQRSADEGDLYVADDTYPSGDYTVKDLIDIMIKYSDNDALHAIVSDPKIEAEYEQIWSLLQFPTQDENENATDFISPKSFSSIFRALYNSSFFQWSLSEQILSLLSQTTFTQGLVAGVPAGTVVSHKFGENTDELHDCGIVYYPDKPYLLCVMTKGDKLETLESDIAGISQIAYQYIDNAQKAGK